MVRRVNVVAHTHWDREWYASFDAFRTRLVEVLDVLLPGLEADPRYETFLLDGQMAVIDDYLEARPDAEERLQKLATGGRLAMGPWYVLMDEFCVSGETIIRNLQLGLDRAERFGGAMPVGYLPDMFGHIGQMPQLLCQAGFEHAVVWRGVPSTIESTAFWWEAPDGSTVRAEYLPVGYANGAHLPLEAASFIRRVRAHEAEVAAFLRGPSAPLLLMNGTDHQAPQACLPQLLDAANALQEDLRFEQCSLVEHLAGAPIEDLPAWRGELRSGARANVLMGVLSNRVDVKAAAAEVERLLERLAEPLAALWLPPAEWPADLLDTAWIEVIRNSAHDSICACSADPVGRAVVHRFDRAAALGGEVVRRSLALAGVATEVAGPVVLNPGPATTGGVVEMTVAGSNPVPGSQVVASWPAGVEERTGLGRDLGRLLGELTADGWLVHNRGTDLEVIAADDAVELRIEVDASKVAPASMASVMAETYAQAGAHRAEPLRIRVERKAATHLALRVEGVPGYGWSALRPSPLQVPPVTCGEKWLDNGLVRIEADPADGTFSVGELRGLDRLVDEGDAGDTYNYSPPPSDSRVDAPEDVTIEVAERGPVRGRLRVRRRFAWPERVEDGERTGRVNVEVLTDIELRAGEPLARVTTSFDNRCRDHRVRSVFPLPERATGTVAECAFATVTRSFAEGRPEEKALPTFPSRRFVAAGGLTVTHEGLLEHELVDDGRALAVTLLRATGVLSRPVLGYRSNSAGPAVPLEDTQMLGPVRARYAVAVGAQDPWRLTDMAWLPLPVVQAPGGGQLAAEGSRLRVEGAEVSALRRVADRTLELRVFNPRGEMARVSVPGHAGWLVDLRGRRLGRWEEEFELRPWGIATTRLDAPTLD